MSKEFEWVARARSSTVRRPSMQITRFHSGGDRVIGSPISRVLRTGMYSTPGILRARTFHSSSRRAASMRSEVFVFSIVTVSVSLPGENWKSPVDQIARA